MHIDLVSSEAWEALGDDLKQSLSGLLFPSQNVVQLRSYKSIGHAAAEAGQTLLQIYSHKKSIGYVKGMSPALEFLLPQYLKEALQVQTIEYLNLTTPSEWCDLLKKDTNFVFLVEDHPITGQTLSVDEVDRILNEKKIFSIRISHARHFQAIEEVRPYSLRINSYGPDLAIAIFGQKFKVQGWTAAQMAWDKVAVNQKIQRKKKRIFDQSLVENFESQMSEKRYFHEATPRLFDRAVLVFKDINGEALIHEIAEALSLNRNSLGDLMATASQCAWVDPISFTTWWKPCPAPEVLRGLVVFSAEILARKDFAKLVKSSYDKVVALQKSF